MVFTAGIMIELIKISLQITVKSDFEFTKAASDEDDEEEEPITSTEKKIKKKPKRQLSDLQKSLKINFPNNAGDIEKACVFLALLKDMVRDYGTFTKFTYSLHHLIT